MSVDIVPFQEDFLGDAAALLAARHQTERVTHPALPVRFEDPLIARKAIELTLNRPQASGVAALDRKRVVGYLIGDVTTDTLLGRSAWVRLAGHALDRSMDVDLYRDLYAALAPQWLARGCFNHYAMMPADDGMLATWFALSFGQEQAYGLRMLTETAHSAGIIPDTLTIRRAGLEDRAGLTEMAPLIAQYQMQAPVWAATPPEHMAEIYDGYEGLVDDPTAAVWLALQGDQLVGFQAYFPAEPTADNLLISALYMVLTVAATRSDERGQGIGRALTQRALTEVQKQGYTHCLTDWRVTNLLSSRFWPRQGFQPVAYRLSRKIDERVLWAAQLADS